MFLFLQIFIVLSSLSRVQSQITLKEYGGDVKKPGESLKLTCAITGFSLSDYYVNWIRQAPGKGLEWIGYYYSDSATQYSDAVKGRFTGSKDSSNDYLHMTSLKTEDTAVYYCAKGVGGLDYWGQGTSVTVTTVSVTAPSVFPLIPCCKDLDYTKEVTIGCLVTGYMPGPVNVTWNSGAISSGYRIFPSVLDSTSGMYTSSSQLIIPGSAWKNTSYQCSVFHEKSGVKQDMTVQGVPDTAPVVKTLLESPCMDSQARGTSNGTMELVCQITRFFPETVETYWLVNGKAASFPTSPLTLWKDKDCYFGASSHMTIPKGQWNQGAIYSCIVKHPSTNFTTQVNISKCSENYDEDLQVHLLRPTFEDLYLEHMAKLTCLVTNIRNTEKFEITWTKVTGSKLDQLTSDLQLQDNGTYSASNVASICAEDWLNGETFTCTVKYQDKPTPITQDISKKKDVTPHQPSVYLLPPSVEELALQEQASLTCLVKEFKPREIFVKWLHEDTEISKESYITTEPIQSQENDAFFLYSQLTIPTSEWNKGKIYTCVVGHEALPMHITQKSIDKSTGKPSAVNVSLVLSEMTNNCY